MGRNLRASLAEHAIEVLHVAENADLAPGEGYDGPAWLVTLINRPAGQTLQVPFYAGSAWWGREPDAADVLSCVLSDATSVINARGYDDWLGDFGMEDQPENRETYDAIVSQTEQVRAFLGELAEFYLWETEHDA
jgi:hypothetical protein